MVRKKIDRKDKQIHGEFVWLAPSEYEHLCDLLGKGPTDRWIADLNLYIGSKGDKYESHYYTIMLWAKRKADKEKGDPSTDSGQAKAQRAADRVIEALRDREAPLPAKDEPIRNALYALLTKKKLTWPRLRILLGDDPTLEPKIREAFIKEYTAVP